jgi:WD40 repeat protein
MSPPPDSDNPETASTDDLRITRRWWLNPVLAQLAFGPDTRNASAHSKSSRGPLYDEITGVDLGDPVQREFGDYELIEQIGRGGMGSIYRARQRNLGREVAIKLLSAGHLASEELIDSLRREAQNAALLQHPNIVVVHEMGEHAGLIFFAMQLVRGRSLSQCLAADGPMPPRQAATLLRAVAEAVDYAHRLGVLHLDLKPGNIMIDESGEPQIADFGLARRLEEALDRANDQITGTPSYMAPEQAQVIGPGLSPATDVWAMGAVLYELLTGEPPFDADDPSTTLRLLLQGQVRKPSRLRPVPPDLEAICLHCLAKDPAQRYISARALADDLARYLDGRGVSVRPLNRAERMLGWARRDPKLATAGALATVALVVGLIATTDQWQRAQANAAISNTRLWESRRETALQLEHDGKGYEAMPRLLQNIEEQERAGHGDLADLDRRRLGMLTGQGATLIDTIAIADANPMAVELSDDGSLLAIALNDRSVRWYDTATLAQRGQVSLQGRRSAAGEERMPVLLRFVDDHRLRVTTEWYTNLTSPDDSDTWLVDLDRQTIIQPPKEFADFADATYSADGQHALLRNHRRQAQMWQVAPWKPLSALSVSTREQDLGEFLPWQLGPGAGYAATFRVAFREMYLFAPPDLSHPASVRFPGDAGISAWTHSHDGRWLALGDFEGRVFLMDTRTRAVRTLPTSRGREITWLAFSEDDGWMAAASWDGLVYAFDVARGESLVSGQMHHDFVVRRVGLSRSRRMLIAAGEGQTALWRLPEPGPRAVPAQRIGAGPAAHGLAGQYPVSWSFQAGLLASAGIDGQVRLWRLPVSPTVTATAARQIAETLQFDGKRLVDVEWNRLRLVSTRGAAASPWITLAQPPGFAELVGQGRTLVVTVGPQLRVYDVPSLHLRFPPIALPNSPQRMLAGSGGDQLFLTTAASGGSTGLQEQLLHFNLRRGLRMAGEAWLAGPLRSLTLSPDGRRLFAVGPADDVSTLLAADSLNKLADLPQDTAQPIDAAAFAGNGGDLWLVRAAGDPRLGSDALLRWNPVTDSVRETHTSQARPKAVIATHDSVFVAGNDHDLLALPGKPLLRLQRIADNEATETLAATADGGIVARGFRRDVQLYDTASGATLGPPLHGDGNAIDAIETLAFTADGRQLLARTMQGHWMIWQLSPDRRPVGEIATQLARLTPDNENQQRVRIPGDGERRRLRANDPGRWLAPSPRPTVAMQAAAVVDRSPIPAREPGTSPLLLDLGSLYASGPDGVRNVYYSIRSQMRPYPAGVQRLGGVDYDMRGMAEIGAVEWIDPSIKPLADVRCIPVPQAVAALHLLLLPVVVAASEQPQTLAHLTWHYRDGSSAVVPLRTQHELSGYTGLDQQVPLVFGTVIDRAAAGRQNETVSGLRLANPHPGLGLQCIDLETTDQPILLFAMTVEPTRSRPSVGAPDVSTTISRIERHVPPKSRLIPGAGLPVRRSP